MSRPIEDLLPERSQGRLRIYAYSIEDDAHSGMLKVGQTTQTVKSRVEQQLKTAMVKNYTIHVDESALFVAGFDNKVLIFCLFFKLSE